MHLTSDGIIANDQRETWSRQPQEHWNCPKSPLVCGAMECIWMSRHLQERSLWVTEEEFDSSEQSQEKRRNNVGIETIWTWSLERGKRMTTMSRMMRFSKDDALEMEKDYREIFDHRGHVPFPNSTSCARIWDTSHAKQSVPQKIRATSAHRELQKENRRWTQEQRDEGRSTTVSSEGIDGHCRSEDCGSAASRDEKGNSPDQFPSSSGTHIETIELSEKTSEKGYVSMETEVEEFDHVNGNEIKMERTDRSYEKEEEELDPKTA